MCASGKSTPDRSLLLDRTVRDRLVAVVVDANAYGKVGPDAGRLASLAADLAKIGIQMWIPEPVTWEWAEHLAAEWTTARTIIRTRLDHLSRAGLPTLAINPIYKNRDEVIEAFLLALSSEAVKTGGSDSAWLRDVLTRAGAPDSLLFLSQDRDIKQALHAWGHGEPLMRTADTIRVSLFEDVPADLVDQWLVARYLSIQLPMNLDDSASGGEESLVGNTKGLLSALDLDWEEHGWTGGRLTKLTALAGLAQVECEAPELHEPRNRPDTRVVRATAFFLADAETSHVFQDDDLTSESTSTHTGLVAQTRLVLQIRGDEVAGVRPDSETMVFTGSRYSDNWDAMEEVEDALTSVPGLVLPDSWGGWQRNVEQPLTVPRPAMQDQTFELIWTASEYGGFVVRVGTDEAEVTCEYDDEAWVGGSDGFYMEPPYYLSVNPGVQHAGAWAVSVWMIDHLLKGDN